MRALLALVFLYSMSTWASHVDITAQTNNGIYRVNAYTYSNSYGRREVRLESNIIGAVQGYGRDLDDDGKIDTWFMLSRDHAIEIHHIPGQDVWGLDAVRLQLFKRYRTSALASLSAAYGSVMSTVLVSAASQYASREALYRELIDLEEFRIRLERAKLSGTLDDKQWKTAADLLLSGYEETIQRFERAMGRQHWTLTTADTGLWVTGGVIMRGLGRALGVITTPIRDTAVAVQAREAFTVVKNAFVSRYRRELARLRVMRGGATRVVAATVFQQNFPRTMRSLMGKNTILRKVLPVIARVGRGFKRATLGWRYIAFMTTLQLGTEAFAHYDEVKSPDPTQFAKNVLSHPDIIQNVSYMSSDAYLMTAASHSVRNPRVKFAMGGFVAMGNSAISNLVIRGSDDYRRVALDTSWEAIIGNAQVQLDLKALQHFERVAARNNNPRLRLIGWAVVFVDQVAGFAAYSGATAMIDGEPKQVQLIPVHVLN